MLEDFHLHIFSFLQTTDGWRARGWASAGKSFNDAVTTRRFPQVPKWPAASRPALHAQLIPVCPAQSAALGQWRRRQAHRTGMKPHLITFTDSNHHATMAGILKMVTRRFVSRAEAETQFEILLWWAWRQGHNQRNDFATMSRGPSTGLKVSLAHSMHLISSCGNGIAEETLNKG